MRGRSVPALPVFLALALMLLGACGAPSQPGAASPVPAAPSSTLAATAPAAASAPSEGAAQQCVAGVIVSGGDTTPPELSDAPRTFSFVVRADDGATVTLTYTAFAPSPAAPPRIRLEFHAGTIQINDYVRACGQPDQGGAAIVVAEEGDYIETYPQKP